MKKLQAKKSNTGITLITLVITIVVLSILAGVSINTVVGDDGIIKKAKEAAETTRRASAEEEMNRLVLEYELAKSDGRRRSRWSQRARGAARAFG